MTNIHGKPEMSEEYFNTMLLLIGALSEPFAICPSCDLWGMKQQFIAAHTDAIVVPYVCDECKEFFTVGYLIKDAGTVVTSKPDYRQLSELLEMCKMDKQLKHHAPMLTNQRRRAARGNN